MKLAQRILAIVEANSDVDPALKILRTLHGAGYEAVIAGGHVRDMLLGKESKDIDIVTDATPDEIESLFPKTTAVGKQFGTIVVIMDGAQFEVTTYRKDGTYTDGRKPDDVQYSKTMKDDASRRDLTINAMYHDPESGEVFDFHGGKGDIEKKLINTVGDPERRFEEDKLRMMRAVRFYTTLQFEMSPRVENVIKRMAPEIKKVSDERIRDEITKILMAQKPSRGFEKMLELGLLQQVLPEVSALAGVEQSPTHHPEGDAWQHTMAALDASGATTEIRWAVLLHDIGKPATAQYNPDKRHNQFLKHEEASAELAQKVLRRLRLTNKFIERVVFAVGKHMSMLHFMDSALKKKRALALTPGFDVLVAVTLADLRSMRKPTQDLVDEVKRIQAMPEIVPAVDGKDLMDNGVKPGPRIGRILNALRNAQLSGKDFTKESALKFARGIE